MSLIRLITYCCSAVLLLMVLAFPACGGQSKKQTHREMFVASIEPVKYLIDNIVGDDFEVVVLVPSGASPEIYEPTPMQIRAAEDANLLFFTGLIDFERELVARLSASDATSSGGPRKSISDGRSEVSRGSDEISDAQNAVSGGRSSQRVIDLSAGIELIDSQHVHACSNDKEQACVQMDTLSPYDPEHAHTHESNGYSHAENQSCEQRTHARSDDQIHVPESDENIHALKSDKHGHAHGGESNTHAHNHLGVDPHIWISPRSLAQMAETAYLQIHALYPDSVSYSTNYERLAERLRELDKEVAERLAGGNPRIANSQNVVHKGVTHDTYTDQKASGHGRAFMIFHPGLTYFARDYGLRQIALEYDGKEPSVRQLQEILDQARREKITQIFYQREFPRAIVEAAAAEIGAQPVEIDILGYDVVANIQTITELMVKQQTTDQR